MPGKLDVYNLAEVGVNTVDSPIHLTDGALTKAQNAATTPEDADGGLMKRPGLAKVNSLAAAGAILRIWCVPFTDPSP